MLREIEAGDISDAPEDALFQVVTKAFETQEEFIFQTIQPFCERQAHMVITKDKLIRALTLLREQEPVKWLKISPAGIYECSGCGQNVFTSDIEVYRFCHGCGRTVKRDAAD